MHEGRKTKTPESMRIKGAANGGFIVTHDYNNFGAGESYMPSKDHAFTGHKEMLAHVADHTGKMGKNGGAEQGTGSPKGVSATPDKGTLHPAGTKAAPSKAAGAAAARKGKGVD